MPYKYYEGSYNGADPYAEYGESRDAARERLLNLVGRSGQLQRQLAAQEQRKQLQANIDTTGQYGDDMMRGASIGSAGGPWGAIIGAAVGRAKGGMQNYQARKDAGQSTGKAFFESFLNPINTLKGLAGGAGNPETMQGAMGLTNKFAGQQPSALDNYLQGAPTATKDKFGNSVAQYNQDQEFQFGQDWADEGNRKFRKG